MRIAIALMALLALATSGCKKKESKPTETGSGSAVAGSDTGSGSAMAGSGSGSAMAGSDTGSAGSGGSAGSAAAGSGAGSAEPTMAHKAGMCPSMVLGATTKAELKGKAVIVTITATDKDAIAAVEKRTTELLAEKKDATKGTAHDQKGTHGGGMGICPVFVPEGATAASKKTKGGVAVTITPKDKPDELKKDIDERITKAADWVKDNIKPGDKGNMGGVGGGKGAHGANHSGEGDSKGQERKKSGSGSGADAGGGGGKGTGGGGGKGAGKGSGGGSAKGGGSGSAK